MFGIVIITHGTLGAVLLETAEFITADRLEAVSVVTLGPDDDSNAIRQRISRNIKKVQQGSGVLILTDMFGGTPSNIGYAFLDEGNVEVLTGVNLPILIKSLSIRKKMDLDVAAPAIEAHGKKSISLASNILKAGKKG